jgi:hypothetical protein
MLWPPSSAGYPPEHVLTAWTRGKFLSLAGNQPPYCSTHSLVTVKQLVHKQLQTIHCAKLANHTQYANVIWAHDIVTDESLFVISVITTWDSCVKYSYQLSPCENVNIELPNANSSKVMSSPLALCCVFLSDCLDGGCFCFCTFEHPVTTLRMCFLKTKVNAVMKLRPCERSGEGFKILLVLTASRRMFHYWAASVSWC